MDEVSEDKAQASADIAADTPAGTAPRALGR